MSKIATWRHFWILWLGGLIIIATLISQGDQLVTHAVPGGMVDHQAAGTADRVNEIHRSWLDNGRMTFAKVAVLFDLLFIVMYSVGGIIGGLLIRQQARAAGLRMLGTGALLAYFLFGVLDFAETLCQAIQIFLTDGHDVLALIASFAQPPKFAAFFAGFPMLVVSLIWLWMEQRRAKSTLD